MPDVNVTTTPDQQALEAQSSTTATPAVVDPTVPAGAANVAPAPKPLTKKQLKKQEKERKRLMASFGKMMTKHQRRQEQIKVEMERLKERVGKKEYKFLLTLATVVVPEKRDEKGEVIQQSSSYLNHELLFKEGKNMIAILRESRIKAGKRKRTSGSRSSRKAHRSTLSAIIERNKQLTEQQAAVVKDPTAPTDDTAKNS